jgi:hypothetical protein
MSVLTTWPFLLALTTLIVNDAWLKGAWPGLVTGKLSDFAGIAVVTLLGLRLWPRPLYVFGLIAAGFAWWKSPWSQALIDGVNSVSPIAIGRVVDYADLLALLVMPLCAAVARNPHSFALPGAAIRRLLLAPVAVATVLAIMGTSAIPLKHDYRVRTIDPTVVLKRQPIALEVEAIAKEQGLECTECADPLNRVQYNGRGLHLEYSFTNDQTVNFQVWARADGMFSSRNSKKLELLRRELKFRLARVQGGLEFVQSLDGQYPP